MPLFRRRPAEVPARPRPVLAEFEGDWAERHPLNTPGAFYGAETDTCCDGPQLAPHSLLVDELGQGFVWRQPRNHAEYAALLAGCRSDPLLGFGADGDDHWTPELVRAWWRDLPSRASRIEEIRREWDDDEQIGPVAAEWAGYLSGPELVLDLRRYLFRLQEGRDPLPADTLPHL
jgi:hypothetical protein